MARWLSAITVLVGVMFVPLAARVEKVSLQRAETGLRWIVTGSKMSQLNRRDPTLASHFFNRQHSYAIGNEFGQQNQVPTGYAATPTLKYESYARFRADIERRGIDPSVKAVIYDPENWSDTPYPERRDPKAYLRRFSRLAHRHGYYVITSPARDLVTVPRAHCRKRSGESMGAAFIRCRIAAAAAEHADAYKVQAQVYENAPTTYRWFVTRTGKQARAANPAIILLSNLATSPADYVATPDMLWHAHDNVVDVVAGHEININSSELGVAEEFLKRLRAAGR
jgi:hypothetical protein